jgi:hypothetical protein
LSVDEYADQVVAAIPPLDDEGRAALARILLPVVRRSILSAKALPEPSPSYSRP